MDKRKTIEIEVKLKRKGISLLSGITYSQLLWSRMPVSLKMDILRPCDMEADKLPLIVFVTGGAFMKSPKESYLQQRLALAEAGYVVASIEYRTIPNGIFPAPLIDVKTAVRYLKANSEKYGIDKERIGLMGDSAGGYLVSMAGATNKMDVFNEGDYIDEESEVKAVVNIYGVSDPTKIADDYSEEIKEKYKSPSTPIAVLINGMTFIDEGGSVFRNPEKTEAANPIKYIRENSLENLPSFLSMHGDEDEVVSPSQSKIIHEALIEKGADSIRYLVKGAGHGGEYWVQDEILEIIIGFFNEKL